MGIFKKTCANCGNEISKGDPAWPYRYGGKVCTPCKNSFTQIQNLANLEKRPIT